MNKTLPVILAALLGLVAGGVLVWLSLAPAGPTNIFIGVHSPASAEPTSTHRPNLTPAREAGRIVRSEDTSKNAPPQRSEVAAPFPRLSDSTIHPEHINNSVVPVQNGSIHTRGFSTTARPLLTHQRVYQGGDSSGLDDALSFALEAAERYKKQGFAVREDFWGGELPVGGAHAIVHQLFKGNEYWFWLGTDTRQARLSVHIYDQDGRLVDVEHWQRSTMAAVRVVPRKTGEYYAVVTIEQSSEALTRWAMTYGFR